MNSNTIRLIAAAATLAIMGVSSAQADTGKVSSAKSMFSRVSASPFSQASTTTRVGASGGDLVINAAGIVSFDGQGASGNTVLTFSAAPGALVDAISFDLTLATIGESWLSDSIIRLRTSNGDGLILQPGYGADEPGTRTFATSGMLSDFELSFNLGADGLLFVEFYEDIDDLSNAADASWMVGNITLGGIAAVVPEPSTYGLMALGIFAVGAAARRRRA